MELLQLLPEVIEGVLLPFLKWNDLLRLRRVCKTTKDIINHYLQVNSALAPQIKIDARDNTFGKFLEMGIPTQKIYLKNTYAIGLRYDLYDRDRADIALFLERYGGTITSLRVEMLSIFSFGKELEFLNTLVNVQELEAVHIGFGCEGIKSYRDDEINTYLDKYFAQFNPANLQNREIFVLPKFMKQLKVLLVGREIETRAQDDDYDDYDVWRRLEKAVERIGLVYWQENEATFEQVSLPFTSDTESMDKLTVGFANYSTAIEARAKAKRDTPKVKIIDLVNFHEHHTSTVQGVTAFLNLCEISVRLGVKLKNVSPDWFDTSGGEQRLEDRLNSPQLGIPVLSLMDLHPCVLRLEMPNLESIKIKGTSQNKVGLNWRERRPEWPALKELDVRVSLDSGETQSLFEFLFQNVVRQNMVELRFRFPYTKADSVVVPNVADIVRSCPNLKKLAVVNWPGSNNQLTELFEGLAELEEVSLENCKDFGNVAMVGDNPKRPMLSNLKKLRKLSLKWLDKMPKVTDLLFTKVIRHLPLTHLILTSTSPLKSVSVKGIQALLEGPFAQSIEKFPFQKFSLAGVPEHEFKRLEQQFRSSHML